MLFDLEYGQTGIGYGIILDQKLVYGSASAAGEIGHTHVIEDGPVCRCGSFGCLEALVGAAALAARVRRAIGDGGFSEALALADGNVNAISGFTVLKAAGMGDKVCVALAEQLANYLGLALANIVNFLNVSTVILDPRLSLAGAGFLDQIVPGGRFALDSVMIAFLRLACPKVGRVLVTASETMLNDRAGVDSSLIASARSARSVDEISVLAATRVEFRLTVPPPPERTVVTTTKQNRYHIFSTVRERAQKAIKSKDA